MGMRRVGVRFMEEESERRLPVLLHVDDFGFCCELEEGLKMMMGWFVEMCRRGLKINTYKSR